MTVVYGPVTFESIIYGPFNLLRNHPVKIALANNGTANANITYIAMDSGQTIGPETMGPSGATVRTLNNIFSFTVDTSLSGSQLTIEIVDINDDIDPKYISAGATVITGTVSTNVAQVAGIDTPATGGTLPNTQAAIQSYSAGTAISTSLNLGVSGWNILAVVPTGFKWILLRIGIIINTVGVRSGGNELQVGAASSLAGNDMVYFADVTTVPNISEVYNYSAGLGISAPYNANNGNFQSWDANPILLPGDVLQVNLVGSNWGPLNATASIYWSALQEPF